MADLNLKATISAQDDTKAAFSSLNDSLNKTKEATQKAQDKTTSFGSNLSGIGSAFVDVGRSMETHVTLPIVGGFALAVKSSADFSQSMLELQTQAGDSAGEVADLSKKLLDMAGQFEQTPAEMAKALFPIESSGFRGSQALDVLTNSAKLASLGQTDLTQTASAVTTVMKAMPGSVKTSSDAVSLMNAIIGNGKMHLDDLNQAMGTGFLSVANTFGVSLQSVGAGLAFMTNQGIPAEDAATKLKMALTLLAAPSTEQVKLLGAIGVGMDDAKAATANMEAALKKGGVTQSQLAADLKKPDGLAVAVQDLKDHLEKSGVSSVAAADIIAKSFGGGRTGTAIMQMVNDTNGLKNTFEAVGKSAGSFAADVLTQAQSPTATWKESLSQLNGALIQFGNVILPIVIPLLKSLTGEVEKLTSWWIRLSPKVQEFIIIGLGIAATLGPLIMVVKNIVSGFMLVHDIFVAVSVGLQILSTTIGVSIGGIIGWFVLLPIAIIATGVLIYTHWKQIKTWTIETWNEIKEGVTEAWTILHDNLVLASQTVVKDITTFWSNIKKFFSDGWRDLTTGVKNGVADIVTFFKTLPDRLAYDLGYIAGAFVRFVTVDIPNFVVNTIKWLEQMREQAHDKIVALFYDVLSWFEQLPGRVTAFLNNLVTTVSAWFSRMHDMAVQTTQRTADTVSSWWSSLPGRVSTAVSNMWNTVGGAFNNFRDSAMTWARNTVNEIVKFFTDLPGQIESSIKNTISKAGSALSSLGGLISKGFQAGLSGRAMGGSVQSNTAYIVGEKGPELFVPSQSGSIVPNDKMGGTQTTVTINFSGNIMNTTNQNLDDIGRRLGKNIVQAIQGQAV